MKSIAEAGGMRERPGDADMLARLTAHRIVALAVVESVADAAPLARALVRGGLPCVEIGMRTSASERVLAALADGRDVLVGAGTVVSADQAERVIAAGAQFIVAPGFSPSVAETCRAVGVPFVPGVSTATEILAALDAGYSILKFFPAENAGGLAALAALSAAFPSVRFIPTGGISPANMDAYLAHPSVAAVGGSWITSVKLLASGNFVAIEEHARQAVARAARHASSHSGGDV